MLLNENVKRVTRLAEEATPGPWFYNSYGSVMAVPLVEEYNRLEGEIPSDAPDSDPRWDALPEPSVAYVPVVAGDTATEQGAKDAAFIAEARTAIPELVAEIERLRGAISDALGWSEGRCREILRHTLRTTGRDA